MIQKTDKTCYKILLASDKISKEDLDKIQKEAQLANKSLEQAVREKGLLAERELLELYAASLKTEYIEPKTANIDKTLLTKIPVKFVWYYKFLPLVLTGKKLKISVSRMLDVHTLDEIRFGLGYELETCFSIEKDLEDAIKQHYGLGADTVERIMKKSPQEKGNKVEHFAQVKEENLEAGNEDASVVQLVNQIILEACKKGASDIHIEPSRGKVRLRYRIDGILQETRVPPEMNHFISPLISRIKIMANLNVVERRLPQDGKARVKTQEQTLNLRVSTLPTPNGESLVIRLLPSKMITSLDDLGFDPQNLERFKELIERPHGILFVTGPTGSGKSTTLYAGLNEINSVKRKILTLEDPIEYEMADMIQMQVMPEIDLTFARGLRSMLRHDPDVMMVGEVRDYETADIAIRVALTGHLILSTLHTNDAASGVTRLLDVGVEPYLIASSVNGFMAQRLVRVICPGCKEEDKSALIEIKQMIRNDLNLSTSEGLKLYRGRGCDNCGRTGFVGRQAIHEVLVVNDDIRQLIISSASAEKIKKRAVELGMSTLRQDGWRKAIQGMTTHEEVIRSTPESKSIAVRSILKTTAETEYIVPPMNKGDDTEAKGRERRRYIRIPVKLDVIFRSVDLEKTEPSNESSNDSWSKEAETDNISAGGISFNTLQKLYPGDILEMKINLSPTSAGVEAIGRVLRVAQTRAVSGEADEKTQNVAVTFLAIHSSDRARIENFCKEAKGYEEI